MAKILIVDGDAFLSKIVRLKLEHAGHQAEVAEDGAIALKQLSKVKPDLIIMEILLSKISGFDILKKVKQINSVKEKIHTLIVTNLASEKDVTKLKELGADKIIIKSKMNIMELLDIVDKTFKHK